MRKLTPEEQLQKKNQIIDDAVAYIVKHGFDKSSIRAICSAAHISTGGFYHYFTTKEEIIQELTRRTLMKLSGWAQLEKEVSWQSLENFIIQTFGYIKECHEQPDNYENQLFPLMLGMAGHNDEVFKIIKSSRLLLRMQIRAQLDRLQQQHQLTANADIDQLSIMIMGVYTSLLVDLNMEQPVDINFYCQTCLSLLHPFKALT